MGNNCVWMTYIDCKIGSTLYMWGSLAKWRINQPQLCVNLWEKKSETPGEKNENKSMTTHGYIKTRDFKVVLDPCRY